MNTYGCNGNTEHRSDSPDAVVRQVIDLAVSVCGFKAGLFRAASLIGTTERWVKSLRFGEPARINADTYLRALEARQSLALERAAQLRAELASLDQIAGTRPNDDATEAPGVLARSRRSDDRDPGRRADHCRGGLAHQAG